MKSCSVVLKQLMYAKDCTCSLASTMTSTIIYIGFVILLHKCFSSLVVGKTVYYIKSTIYTPCSEESCLTLLQFAAHTKNYLEPNTSLIFLPGYHSLSLDLYINAVSKLSMHSNSTLVSATPTISCEEQASITFWSIDDVYIGNLTFIGCHGNQVTSVKTIILENTTFINHTGSALQLLSSGAFIVRCSFISNAGGSYRRRPVKVAGDEYLFPNRVTYIKAGAAMTLTNSSADISDCVFVGNHAQMGSAIFSELHSNLRLTNTVFERNHIKCGIGGGSICIGGALYSGNGTIQAYNCTFFDNKLSIRGEKQYHLFPYGGVFGLFDSIFVAKNCNFTHNGPDHFSAESESGYGGTIHAYNSTMNIASSNFMSNTNASYGGAISISNAICIITHSNFTTNTCNARGKGGAIHSEKSSVTISNSEFKNNSLNSTFAINGLVGGVLFIYVYRKQANNTKYTYRVMNSVFEDNKGSFGGVITVEGDVYLDIINCNFSRNHATTSGGVMYMDSVGVVTIIVASSLFSDNSAELFGGGIAINNDDAASNITLNGIQFLRNTASQGGAIFLQWDIQMVISNSKFVENAAAYGGAIICTTDTNITIEGGMIDNNMAHIGVVFVVEESSIDILGTVISNNTVNRAVVYIIESVGYLSDITLADNTGSIFVYFANLTLSGTVIIANGSPHCQLNSNKTVSYTFEEGGALIIFPEGGAITTVQANVAIEGTCTLSNNYAENGGAFYATKSRIHVYGMTIIGHNVASDSGGGIYLHQSGLKCYKECIFELVNNTSGYKGGGIYITSSSISAENQGQITFRENDAAFAGGGICIEQNLKLYVLITTNTIVELDTLTFLNNSANYGGAVYVSDETNSGTCASESYQVYSTKTECFLQVLSLQSEYFGVNNIGIMLFIDNHAYISGSDLFGGLLDRCTISPLAEKRSDQPYIIDGASYFLDVSNIEQLDTISSAPISICFCNKDKQPDCSYHPPIVNVTKGETFTVSLVAVDQVKRTVANVTIRSSLSSSFGGLGENRQNQSTGADCTDLMFEVFSPHSSEQLILYADGPCKDAPLSQGIININFSSCDCPIGFQQKLTMKVRSVCECECDSDLHPYVFNCDPEAETITREGDFWVDYINNGRNYLVHPHCPYDYCKPSDEKIALNLNHKLGADAQCANKRSGILCAQCSLGTSLSIGSSLCIQCPTYWPLLTVILLITSILAGICLVALILMLNLTVAVGTLNGVIFYANIVAANTNTIFPPNVIIAWLNLEPGINVCFFDGMTTYWKTWLQLAFPAYIIFLVAMIILISDRSKRFSKLIGKKDPVATLATLLLFSYAKFLYTIIASLSGTILKYPETDGTHDRIVWLPDATIKYLSGIHSPLFIIAILILLAGIAYTIIIFSWQWLLHFNHSPKLSLFIQTYHAPYTPKHRYWTGLLLIARIILYAIFAANIKGDPKINLIAIGMVVVSILIVKDFVEGSGQLYQKRPIEMLEIACHFNLLILCIITFFALENEAAKNIFAQISMSFMILLLLGVLIYHLFTEGVFKTKLWKQYKRGRQHLISTDVTESDTVTNEQIIPSCSIIEAPKRPSILLRGRKGGKMSSIDNVCKLRETLLDHGDAN